MTYLEALCALQQRGLDALKVAQTTQLALLATTRDCAAPLSESNPQALPLPPIISDMTTLMTSFTFQVLEAQVAYAKELADMLTPTPAATSAAAAATETMLPVRMADEKPPSLGAPPAVEAWLDAQSLAGEQSEILSKVLTPPIKSTRSPGPNVPSVSDDGVLKTSRSK